MSVSDWKNYALAKNVMFGILASTHGRVNEFLEEGDPLIKRVDKALDDLRSILVNPDNMVALKPVSDFFSTSEQWKEALAKMNPKTVDEAKNIAAEQLPFDPDVAKFDWKTFMSLMPVFRVIAAAFSDKEKMPKMLEASLKEVEGGVKPSADAKDKKKPIQEEEVVQMLKSFEDSSLAISEGTVLDYLKEVAYESFSLVKFIVAFKSFCDDLGEGEGETVVKCSCALVMRGTKIAKMKGKSSDEFKTTLNAWTKAGLKGKAAKSDDVTLGRVGAAFPSVVCWVLNIAVKNKLRRDPVSMPESDLPLHFRFSSFPSLATDAMWAKYSVKYKEYMNLWLDIINAKKTEEEKKTSKNTQTSIIEVQRTSPEHAKLRSRYIENLKKLNVGYVE